MCEPASLSKRRRKITNGYPLERLPDLRRDLADGLKSGVNGPQAFLVPAGGLRSFNERNVKFLSQLTM